MMLQQSDIASDTSETVVKLLKLLDGRLDHAPLDDRRHMLKAVTYLFVRMGAAENSLAHFDDLFLRLGASLDVATLAAFANALAPAPVVPAATLRMLAWHEDAAVADPILARSVALSRNELTALATAVDPDRLRSICTRARIDAELSAIIIRRGDPAATQRLLGNPGAAFTLPDFRNAVSRAVSDSRGRIELRQPVDILDFAGRRSGRCMTRDISPRGVKIELAGGGRPPDSFMIELPGIEHARLTCRYVWHRDSMVGAMLPEPLFDQLAAQQSR